MKEILSATSIDNIYKEIIEEKNYTIHAEVEGLIVGLDEFFEKLETQKKEILKEKKRFKLDKLIFDSDISRDVKLFFEYVGYFNEGSMKMIVYSQEKKYMVIDLIDGDEIVLERFFISNVNTDESVHTARSLSARFPLRSART